jgi:hypothetical protein
MVAGLLIPDELTDEQYATTIRNLHPDSVIFDILPPVETIISYPYEPPT